MEVQIVLNKPVFIFPFKVYLLHKTLAHLCLKLAAMLSV